MKILTLLIPATLGLNCPAAKNGAKLAQYSTDKKCVYIYENTPMKWIEAEKVEQFVPNFQKKKIKIL